MAPRQSATSPTVYQLKMTLTDAKPPIWRRVQVLDTTTLQQLHHVIQRAMGWTDSHLHQFTINGIEYGQPLPEYEFNVCNEKTAKLSQLVTSEKFKFLYTYDMGVKCQLHWHINLKAFSSLFEQLDQLEKSKKEEIATTRNDNN